MNNYFYSSDLTTQVRGNQVNSWLSISLSVLEYELYVFALVLIYEPGHEKMCLMSYANNKGADQPAHSRSLISAFVVRCLDSIISPDSIAEISRL